MKALEQKLATLKANEAAHNRWKLLQAYGSSQHRPQQRSEA
jgi:hypothetical protein